MAEFRTKPEIKTKPDLTSPTTSEMAMIQKWEVLGRQSTQDFGLFKVWEKQARSPRTGRTQKVLSIDFPNWVLVVAVTSNKEILMVRQYRHGNEQICLELPGGLVDSKDRSPKDAAERELLEETGFKAGRMVLIGECFPQPAVLSNKCFFYLAEDAESIRPPDLDPGEDMELVRVPSKDALAMVTTGEITNGMVQLALFFYSSACRIS